MTWFAVVIASVAVGLVLLWLVRKRVRGGSQEQTFGFSLDEIRALRDRGEITVAEYESLRRKLIEGEFRKSHGRKDDERG